MPNKRLPPLRKWSSVGRWTLFGTCFCVLVSLAFNRLAFGDLGPEAMHRSLLSATALPVILGAPLFFFIGARLRGLTISNLRLDTIARTDSLTACLNRGAFTARVSEALAPRPQHTPSGALLMIDADNFKSINDDFGHEAGDEALRIIVRAIRSVLRAGDVIGRIGGEEFAVFLPDADLQGAETVAERIRRSVNLAIFAPRDAPRQLSVSIGGVVFKQAASFSDLFRVADHKLYGAKNTGRNCVSIALAADDPVFAGAMRA